MKIRNVDLLEQELKNFLSDPKTTDNLSVAVSKAKKILNVKKDNCFANYTLALNEVVTQKNKSSEPDYSAAIESFERIIKIDPNFLEAYLMLVKIYKKIDRQKEYDLLKKANKKFPDHYLIMFELANIMCFKTGEKFEGLELFSKCVQKLPMVDAAWAGVGSAYLINREFEMALKSFETCLAINPKNLTAILGIGVYYYENAEFTKAHEYYDKALEIDKNSFWGNFNKALLSLLEGDYKNGLEIYEKRDKDQYLKEYGGVEVPEINKNEVIKHSNKRLLVLREQGFGDDVMYSRYLKPLKELGYDVTYACPPELKDFFRLSPDLDDIKVDNKIPKSFYHYRSFLLSLPWITSNFIKDKIGKPLKIDLNRLDESKVEIPKKYKELTSSKKLKIGIAWSGRPTHIRDFNRNIHLEMLSSIFDCNADFFVLQKFYKGKDPEFLKKFKNVHNCSDYLKNFLHTTYFLNKMDLVFSVDTSLVHLSGTLGKRTYLFLPMVPDFRWGLKQGQEWYPSVKLLRQKALNDWTHPINECKKIIKEKLGSS